MKKKPTPIIVRGDLEYKDLDTNDKNFILDSLKDGISRREMLSWMMAAGITTATAGSFLSFATDTLAATPIHGGKIKCAMNQHGPDDTLDPQRTNSQIDYTRGRIHFNNLVQLSEDLIPQPELAEEFSSNANATEWTFKLRKDVRFHDGSKLTADDVVWTLRRHSGKDSKSNVKAMVSSVKEWKKIDNYTMKVILDSPDADFATILGTNRFKILKKDTTNFQNPVGTGPFRLEEFKPGVRSIHVRNESYWREGPNLDEIELFAITDAIARVNALISGDAHMIQGLDFKAIRQIESTPGFGVLSVPSGGYFGMCCMTNTAPGNNRDFVMAMKYLQQRERIVKSILKNQGTVGNDHPIGSAYPDHCADLPQRPFDPDKAKFHLKKSGIGSAEIHVAEVSAGITDTALMLQREASKVGFDLKVKRVPTEGYWGAVWMKTPMFATVYNMRPTANIMLSLAFAPDAPSNDTLWKNDRMGKLLKESRAVTDPAKRSEMYCEMQKLISDECGMLIPTHANYVDAKVDKLKGIGKVPIGPLGGAEWPEFAWLEK